MVTSMLTGIGNRLIFPAPRPSYDRNAFKGNLYYVPWDLGIGIPAVSGYINLSFMNIIRLNSKKKKIRTLT